MLLLLFLLFIIGIGALLCGGGQNILMMVLIKILPTDNEGYFVQFKLNEQTSYKRQNGITLSCLFELCVFNFLAKYTHIHTSTFIFTNILK